MRAGGIEARSATGWETGPADAGLRARAALIDRLSREPGKHLVIVRYSPTHNVHEEWVFNGADIDGSRIVWAREMDAAANARLLEYFKDRKAWLLEPDRDPVNLLP